MTMNRFPFKQQLSLALHPKGKRCLNTPKMLILPRRCFAIGLFILNTMTTRNRHKLPQREPLFPRELDATGSSCIVRQKRNMEMAFLVCFPSTTTAEGTEHCLLGGCTPFIKGSQSITIPYVARAD